jgi:oligopeptide/dipeptide ABC transporter ATP-binding protein
MALLAQPKLLIADEPTTALDKATQKQTLELLKSLQGQMPLLVISHDLEAISYLCDSTAIMYGGRIVERGTTSEVFNNPRHPYTRLFLSCQKLTRGKPLPSLSNDSLDLINFPNGCSFHPNCPHAMPVCSQLDPLEVESGDVKVSCHLFTNRRQY